MNYGLNLKFNITDAYGNNVDTILLARNNPDFGQMTYKLNRRMPKKAGALISTTEETNEKGPEES